MDTHEHYEELCALVASGQASQDETLDLRSHLESCSECQNMSRDFSQISAQGLTSAMAARTQWQVPTGMTHRFLARARSEGIKMHGDAPPAEAKPKRYGRLALVAASITAGFVLLNFLLFKKFETLHQEPSHPVSETTLVAPISNSVSANTSDDEKQSQQKLASAQTEIASMAATITAQRNELESLRNDKEALSSRLDATDKDSSALRASKAENEARIAELERTVATAKSEKDASDIALASQEIELRQLKQKVVAQTEALAEREELVATGREVRDLVIARNLHIIDVHDRDGDGKSQRAFGRIFYTEGKSLTFYAYDLADSKKLNAKVSFHVWGGRIGADRPIKNLGVFHNDDEKEGRWVLTFDDPRILTQIDSVFVTIESSKKIIDEPKGPKILFAFLGSRPNHP